MQGLAELFLFTTLLINPKTIQSTRKPIFFLKNCRDIVGAKSYTVPSMPLADHDISASGIKVN